MKVLLITVIAAGALMAAAAFAADEKAPAVKAPTPSGPAGMPSGVTDPKQAPGEPVIPVELQMEYFRTDGALAHLRAEIAAAQAEYDAAVAAIVKSCGAGSAPTLTQDKKRLFCVAQQAPAAKK